MELKLGFANYLLSFVTPLVTSSIFAASPSLAATLVSSEARVFLDDFSHKPFAVSTLTDADTVAIASNGGVAAEAEADASAAFLSKMGVVENFSSSLVKGDGNNYFGMAKSVAEVIAYDFRIKAKATFSFDFLAFLGLETSTDNPKVETTNAYGDVLFKLYDTTDPDNWLPLDSFSISGNLETPGNDDFIQYQVDGQFTLADADLETDFEGTERAAVAELEGSYSRYFDSLTYVTLLETKMTKASASVKTPETSNMLGLLLFGLLGVGYGIKTKAFESKSKFTE